jgi:hypothetical protein
MRKNTKKENSFASGWKKLAPKSSRRPASRAALRKRLTSAARVFLLLVLFGSLGYGIWWIDKLARSDSGPIDLTGPGMPISGISFQSDGVLSDSWFKNWFGPLRGRTLMELDIEEMQENLVAEDQISFARVTRAFPDTLRIELNERHPILVLRLGAKSGAIQDWLVSPDGTLYLGTGYPRSTLSLLPSLSVDPLLLRPKKEGKGYERLEGIPPIAPLLDLVRRDYPGIYRDWHVVSYERPNATDPGAHVRIRSGRVRSLRFSPGNYAVQMRRLHYLLLEPKLRRSPVIDSIDLSHGRSVFAKI